MTPSDAVLLMTYGTPTTPADIAPYYTHIRGGRAPNPEQIKDLADRYAAIGGSSPLLTITQALADALAVRLGSRVYVGMKHWHPFIEETVEQMHREGVHRAVAITLAPHYSRMSVGAYIKTAQAASEKHGGPLLHCVESWHRRQGLITALGARVRDALRELSQSEATVIFTAHSLPKRISEWNDPYPTQLVETSKAVAATANVTRWSFAFQSASATGEPWLGPDVLNAIRDLHGKGIENVVICPIGFVADHLEILYDIDVEAKQLADRLKMRLVRTKSLNASPEFIEILAEITQQALAAAV